MKRKSRVRGGKAEGGGGAGGHEESPISAVGPPIEGSTSRTH